MKKSIVIIITLVIIAAVVFGINYFNWKSDKVASNSNKQLETEVAEYEGMDAELIAWVNLMPSADGAANDTQRLYANLMVSPDFNKKYSVKKIEYLNRSNEYVNISYEERVNEVDGEIFDVSYHIRNVDVTSDNRVQLKVEFKDRTTGDTLLYKFTTDLEEVW